MTKEQEIPGWICLFVTALLLCVGCQHTGPHARRIDRAPHQEPVAQVEAVTWWRAFGATELELLPDTVDRDATMSEVSRLTTDLGSTHWTTWQHELLTAENVQDGPLAPAWRHGIYLTLTGDAALTLLRKQTTEAQVRALAEALQTTPTGTPEHASLTQLLNVLSRREMRQKRSCRWITDRLPRGASGTLFVATPAPPAAVDVRLLARRPDVMAAEAALLQVYHLATDQSIQLPAMTLTTQTPLSELRKQVLSGVHFPILEPEERQRLEIDAATQARAREHYLYVLARALGDLHTCLARAHQTFEMSERLPPANATAEQRLQHLDERLTAARCALLLRAELGTEW